MSIKEEAIEKLEKEFKAAGKLSRHGAVVAEPVLTALKEFCGQNAEFAQAVVQSSRDLKGCIEGTVAGAEGSISDIEVYRRAAAYYFDGASVSFVMKIEIGAATANTMAEPVPAPNEGLQISLDDLLF